MKTMKSEGKSILYAIIETIFEIIFFIYLRPKVFFKTDSLLKNVKLKLQLDV